jgi:hypothetical protein
MVRTTVDASPRAIRAFIHFVRNTLFAEKRPEVPTHYEAPSIVVQTMNNPGYYTVGGRLSKHTRCQERQDQKEKSNEKIEPPLAIFRLPVAFSFLSFCSWRPWRLGGF